MTVELVEEIRGRKAGGQAHGALVYLSVKGCETTPGKRQVIGSLPVLHPFLLLFFFFFPHNLYFCQLLPLTPSWTDHTLTSVSSSKFRWGGGKLCERANSLNIKFLQDFKLKSMRGCRNEGHFRDAQSHVSTSFSSFVKKSVKLISLITSILCRSLSFIWLKTWLEKVLGIKALLTTDNGPSQLIFSPVHLGQRAKCKIKCTEVQIWFKLYINQLKADH